MKFRSCLHLLVLVLSLPTLAQAHVGSPDVFFEGHAGPYPVFVTVRLPLVIPGVAEIGIRSESKDLRELRIVPLRLTGPGSDLPPAPDVTQRAQDDPQFFSGSLWLMESGSLQVRILAEGGRGKGEVSVPVPSVAQRVLPMRKTLGLALFALMVFLVAGAISIAAAAAREGSLEAGERAGPADARRGRVIMTLAAVVILGMLYLGYRWWDSEAKAYTDNIYRPPQVNASLEAGGRLILHGQPSRIRLGFRARSRKSAFDDLIPDHGHLVHLFLIRVPQMDRFWHLHPEQIEPGTFREDLPGISAGHYRIFADVVHQSGFPETMIGEVDLPDLPGAPASADDCGWSGEALSGMAKTSVQSPLPDGGRMIWDREGSGRDSPLKANAAMSFRFRIEDRDGRPAKDLEPYMGMPGHAEFVRADGSVFAHVHPAGSVSMAALELAQSALMPRPGAVAPGMPRDAHTAMAMPTEGLPPQLSFPYGFPKPGAYRIFVQIKRAGRIETGMFDATVD